MSEFDVREGMEAGKVFRDIERLPNGSRAARRRAWLTFGGLLRDTASKQILDKSTKTGRIYRVRRGKTRRRHQASAPGETHANLSGTLRKSIGFQVVGPDELHFGYGVAAAEGKEAPVHAIIEFGRQDGKIEARPSLQNAINAVNPTEFFELEMARLL